MAKSAELRVDIDPTLLERARKEARRVDIRLPSLVELALIQFLERTESVAAIRREIGDALARQAIVDAKIEHIAQFVADVLGSQRSGPVPQAHARPSQSSA
ncbi:hypothetical protein [Bosea massiliensis]|uniref:Ribbon-helix-helix protein CopG domain-containing protein n=1 Tax=Bosea massiliensis TaxID=151419 RepID=A0ABW0P6A4_9HYPH